MIETMSSLVVADGVGWDHMGGWDWGGMLFGWLMMGGLVLLIVWAVSGGGSVTRPSTATALDVLAERFVRGEITSEEYRERREVLVRGSRRKAK